MRLASEIIGTQIVSLSDGSRIGTVCDLFLDRNTHTVAALHLGDDDLFGGRSGLIERSKVAAFGRDAILTVDSEVVVVDRHARSGFSGGEYWLLNAQLLGREVQTAGGRPLGTAVDLILSDVELEILGLVIAAGDLGDRMGGSATTTPRSQVVLRDHRAREPVAIRIERSVPLLLVEAD